MQLNTKQLEQYNIKYFIIQDYSSNRNEIFLSSADS